MAILKDNKIIATDITTQLNTKAPLYHASTGTTYGVGNASNYGHVRLLDSYSSTLGASNGYAATPWSVYYGLQSVSSNIYSGMYSLNLSAGRTTSINLGRSFSWVLVMAAGLLTDKNYYWEYYDSDTYSYNYDTQAKDVGRTYNTWGLITQGQSFTARHGEPNSYSIVEVLGLSGNYLYVGNVVYTDHDRYVFREIWKDHNFASGDYVWIGGV